MSAMVEPILHFLTIIRETRGGLRLLHSALHIYLKSFIELQSSKMK